jgi:hypothetical protein
MANRFKNLEDAFDLAPSTLDIETAPPDDQEVADALAMADDIDRQLSAAQGRDLHDTEMDELADLAIQAHKDLQDLGMNVEIRHAGEIFSSSSQMLKIAVDAKNHKIDKKLKMLKLQLDKLKLDRTTKPPEGDPLDVRATLMDRNELLRQLGQIQDDTK